MSKTDPDDDNPEWTDADFARARPFPEMFPELARKLRSQGGRPRLARPKVHVGFRLAADVVMAPVLRAGLGMLPGMLELVPNARVGHLGLQRDERTAVASQYYAKLPPNIEKSYVLLIDPMLATGGSAVAALDMLTKAGARHMRLVCIVAAPEGVAAVEKAYPAVPIFAPVVDRELDTHKFIVPGLGDFGDRLFGTT